jgi:hypothetical protein
VEATNQLVYMETTLIVPPEQAHKGVIFLWPGLQPGGANFNPIGTGVLQPVLTWGSSCAPGNQPAPYSTWWISAQYVNSYGNLTGHRGCFGGPIMDVNPGNQLRLQFELNGTVWTQIVTNLATNKAVMFSIDMLGQAQNYVYFFIELYSAIMAGGVEYLNSFWQFENPSNSGCTLSSSAPQDSVSTPQPSADKRSCSVAKIIQYVQ